MFLSDIPKVAQIYDNAGNLTKDLAFGEQFEVLTARVLRTRIAQRGQVGYDLYDSDIYPDLTFQVKASRIQEVEPEAKVINGRAVVMRAAPTWTWSEARDKGGDFYVLFGVKADMVFPFVVSRHIWLAESFPSAGGCALRVCSNEYSRCGRYVSSFKRNKFWEYSIREWPRDLFRRIEYYTNDVNAKQLAFIDNEEEEQ